MHLLRPVALSLLAPFACIDAHVNFPVGPIEMSVDLPVDTIPASLRQQDGTLRRVSCSGSVPCPATESTTVTLRCLANVCALPPLPFDATSPDIDLTTYETWGRYAHDLDSVRLIAINLQVAGAQPNHTLGPTELFWRTSPATPARRLGFIARTALAAGSVELPVVLTSAGAEALVDAILAGSVQFQIRLAGTVELGPGPLPEPQLQLSLNLLLGLVGSL